MTQISKSLIPFLIFFAFVSCDNSKKEPEKSKYEIRSEKQDKLDTLNLIEAQRLSQTNNSIIGWDTTENFTYSLQESFKSEAKPISFIGEIKDIIKKDSTYILKVMNTSSQSSKNFIAEISVTANMFQSMKSKLDPNETNEGCFIFKPTSIRSSSLLKIDSEVSTDEDAQTVDDANANASSELTYDSSNIIVFFKGDMINFYLYKRL
jgi:hypothetical protein